LAKREVFIPILDSESLLLDSGVHDFEKIVEVYFAFDHGVLRFEHFGDFLFWKLDSCDLRGSNQVVSVDEALVVFIVELENPLGWSVVCVELGLFTNFGVYFKSDLVGAVLELFFDNSTVVEFCGKGWSFENDRFFDFMVILLLEVLKGPVKTGLGTGHGVTYNVGDGQIKWHIKSRYFIILLLQEIIKLESVL
jgi:hypothetical protein